MGKKGPVLELEQDSPLLCLPEFHVGMVVLTEALPSWEVGHCDRGASDAYLSISQMA